MQILLCKKRNIFLLLYIHTVVINMYINPYVLGFLYCGPYCTASWGEPLRSPYNHDNDFTVYNIIFIYIYIYILRPAFSSWVGLL